MSQSYTQDEPADELYQIQVRKGSKRRWQETCHVETHRLTEPEQWFTEQANKRQRTPSPLQDLEHSPRVSPCSSVLCGKSWRTQRAPMEQCVSPVATMDLHMSWISPRASGDKLSASGDKLSLRHIPTALGDASPCPCEDKPLPYTHALQLQALRPLAWRPLFQGLQVSLSRSQAAVPYNIVELQQGASLFLPYKGQA